MKIKRFFAKDMRQAIREIREDLGPDAVILSTRNTNGGIEIVSAIEYDETLLGNAPDNKAEQANQPASERYAQEDQPLASTSEALLTDTSYSPQAEWMEDPMIAQMRHEIKDLRGVLESQLSHLSQVDIQRHEPEKAAVMRRLEQMGIEPRHARQLVTMLTDDTDLESGWHQTLALMSHQIQVADDDILDKGGVVALVGPTGVGKTTTIAKLAARFSLRHGNRQLALISTDSYRIGAQEQLLNFGRILDIPTYSVSNAEELSQKLNDLQDKRLVLVDTAGMSQRDIRLSEQLQTLADSPFDIQTYMVLAANTQASTLLDTMYTFRKSRINGAFLTKLDETTSLGGALSALIQCQMPVAYISDGQQVPEDLHRARAHTLVSRAVTLMQQYETRLEKYPNPMNINRKVANAHV